MPDGEYARCGDKCSVCLEEFRSGKNDYIHRRSMTFPFSCTGCVIKSARLKRRHNRRGSRLGVDGKLEVGSWLLALLKNNFACAECGVCNYKLTLDHIKPLREGGNNSLDNIQPLCFFCHSKKDGFVPRNGTAPKHMMNAA